MNSLASFAACLPRRSLGEGGSDRRERARDRIYKFLTLILPRETLWSDLLMVTLW